MRQRPKSLACPEILPPRSPGFRRVTQPLSYLCPCVASSVNSTTQSNIDDDSLASAGVSQPDKRQPSISANKPKITHNSVSFSFVLYDDNDVICAQCKVIGSGYPQISHLVRKHPTHSDTDQELKSYLGVGKERLSILKCLRIGLPETYRINNTHSQEAKQDNYTIVRTTSLHLPTPKSRTRSPLPSPTTTMNAGNPSDWTMMPHNCPYIASKLREDIPFLTD
ncbi:hypothetical protein QBC36DRAFT_310092 [Triangularia setosa]|uniref:Uncharacterized protein n=1 Tax=Triangularia setosa TaxID=2587417 RepID=A0AAN6W913_9PEZI|nr:hypothetical protein QBC36DRAFT_310092 [Podospora setosa]